MDGHWRSDSLTDLIRIFAASTQARGGLESRTAPWRRPVLALLHALRRNTRPAVGGTSRRTTTWATSSSSSSWTRP